VPTGVSVASITSSSAMISWTGSTGAVSYTIGYRVSGTTTFHDTTVTGTSLTLTGLLAGTTYNYRIEKNCTGGGTSTWTTISSFTTLTTSAPCSVPTGLTATSITSSSATISWTAVTGAVGYKIKYKKASGSSSTWIVVPTTSTTVNLTGLTYATTYDYEVETMCTSDSSGYSSASTFTTLTCMYPSGITLSSITSTSATLSWTGVTGATSYTVGYHTSGSTIWTDVITTSSPYTLTGLTPDSTYTFDIQTTCTGGGTSSWSSTSSFTHSRIPLAAAHQPVCLLPQLPLQQPILPGQP
jgi:hypothetical protein